MTITQAARRRRLIRSVRTFVVAVVSLLAVRWLLFEPFVIPSGSMIPALLVHDHIIVAKYPFGLRVPFTNRWIWKWAAPKNGEVVVFRSVDDPSRFLVKRVTGVPGETIEGVTLAEDQYFMMGDNRFNSMDSRVWGPITSNHLIGKAKIIWLSCETTLPTLPFVCDPTTIRWERMFKLID